MDSLRVYRGTQIAGPIREQANRLAYHDPGLLTSTERLVLVDHDRPQPQVVAILHYSPEMDEIHYADEQPGFAIQKKMVRQLGHSAPIELFLHFLHLKQAAGHLEPVYFDAGHLGSNAAKRLRAHLGKEVVELQENPAEHPMGYRADVHWPTLPGLTASPEWKNADTVFPREKNDAAEQPRVPFLDRVKNWLRLQ